jgi:large subunit ribosomal protein L21e
MVRRKKVRTRGKLKLSEYFKKLSVGDKVALVKERSVVSNFPARMTGRTGTVTGIRGKSYIVDALDQKMKKTFIVHPIHLKKIKEIKSNDKGK